MDEQGGSLGKRKKAARRAQKFIALPLQKAAKIFERNHLYISAAITNIKIISYYTAILDVFDYDAFRKAEDRSSLIEMTSDFFKDIHKSGLKALHCIDKARQLETSQSNKTLLIYDFNNRLDSDEMSITRLFDMFLNLWHVVRIPPRMKRYFGKTRSGRIVCRRVMLGIVCKTKNRKQSEGI